MPIKNSKTGRPDLSFLNIGTAHDLKLPPHLGSMVEVLLWCVMVWTYGVYVKSTGSLVVMIATDCKGISAKY